MTNNRELRHAARAYLTNETGLLQKTRQYSRAPFRTRASTDRDYEYSKHLNEWSFTNEKWIGLKIFLKFNIFEKILYQCIFLIALYDENV